MKIEHLLYMPIIFVFPDIHGKDHASSQKRQIRVPAGTVKMYTGCSRNIDAELKNIFSPIRASHSSHSNASSVSYGTPEHTGENHSGAYQDPKVFSSEGYYQSLRREKYSSASELLMARPNSSGPSVFMREFGRDHR